MGRTVGGGGGEGVKRTQLKSGLKLDINGPLLSFFYGRLMFPRVGGGIVNDKL